MQALFRCLSTLSSRLNLKAIYFKILCLGGVKIKAVVLLKYVYSVIRTLNVSTFFLIMSRSTSLRVGQSALRGLPK